jgi:hypothetical protein
MHKRRHATPRRRWDAQDDFVLRRLRENGRDAKWIARFMCCNVSTIHRRARLLGIEFHRHCWSVAEDAELRRRYPDERAASIARDFGFTLSQVYQRAAKLGLHKSDAFMASDRSGRVQRGKQDPRMVAHQFKKGSVPANKGLRRPGWHRGRMRETQFRKGRPAHENANYVPIGTERVEPRDGYLIRKVTDDRSLVPARRWVAVHRLVWEAVNGPIPKGHVVRFKPGMKTTVASEITLDKLDLVSQADNMRRNSIHNYPAPLKEVVQLSGRLMRQIHKREKRA